MEYSIGRKIKYVRELKNISLKQMAITLEMTEQGYAKIERGDSDVSYNKLMKIASVLEEKIENLVSFDPKMVFQNNTITTITGNVYSYLSDNERKLYEERISALLKEINELKSL